MTEQRLDRVARALATRQPRRAVLKAGAAAAAGGAFTMIVRHEDIAEARFRLQRCCKRKKQAAIEFCRTQGPTCTGIADFTCGRRDTTCAATVRCVQDDGSPCP
jgi:hypothetical protein